MPTKKQRRRRQKGRRHEYEYVYVDEEGRELGPDDVREEGAKPAKAETKKPARGTARTSRGVRTIQPPSWRRVGKRGLIFAPLMFVVVTILSPDFTPQQRITQTLFLLMIFLPFSYVMDALTYRMWKRRTAQPDDRGAKR